jgi:hypothetical protein
MDDKITGRPPKLNDAGQQLVKKSFSVYPDQIAWIMAQGGSKFLRELIDKRRAGRMLRGAR